MNAGAKANVDKAQKIATSISRWRSEGLTYHEIGKRLGISPEAAKQRLFRYRKHEVTDG